MTFTAIRLLFATDDSDSARAAETWIRRMAWPAGTSVDVACIGGDVEPRIGWWGERDAEARQVATDVRRADLLDAEAVANAAAERLQRAGFVTRSWASPGSAHEQLPALVERLEPDLVVVGSRGRSRLGRALLGSVSSRLVSTGARSTLVVRHAPDGEGRLPRTVAIVRDGPRPEGAIAAQLSRLGFTDLPTAHTDLEGMHGRDRPGADDRGGLIVVARRPTARGRAVAERAAEAAGGAALVVPVE